MLVDFVSPLCHRVKYTMKVLFKCVIMNMNIGNLKGICKLMFADYENLMGNQKNLFSVLFYFKCISGDMKQHYLFFKAYLFKVKNDIHFVYGPFATVSFQLRQ